MSEEKEGGWPCWAEAETHSLTSSLLALKKLMYLKYQIKNARFSVSTSHLQTIYWLKPVSLWVANVHEWKRRTISQQKHTCVDEWWSICVILQRCKCNTHTDISLCGGVYMLRCSCLLVLTHIQKFAWTSHLLHSRSLSFSFSISLSLTHIC